MPFMNILISRKYKVKSKDVYCLPVIDHGWAAAALVLLHHDPGPLPVHQHQHRVLGVSGIGGEWLHVAHHLRPVQGLPRPCHKEFAFYIIY